MRKTWHFFSIANNIGTIADALIKDRHVILKA